MRARLGQHFLVDRTAVARIVEMLAPRPGEALLEIGPGRGALTGSLLDAAGRVVVVELDAHLAAELAGRFAEPKLTVIQDDILNVDLRSLLTRRGGESWVVAGNLPYNVSKPVALKLVRERAVVDRAVLMFQKEVALRLTASPGSKAYGALSVLAGETYEIDALFDLAPGAFRPRPKVLSTVTSWRRKPLSRLAPDDERRLRRCLSVCFARRRKTLRNNLRAALASMEQVEGLLGAAGLDGALRAEVVPPEGFRRLARAWPASPADAALV